MGGLALTIPFVGKVLGAAFATIWQGTIGFVMMMVLDVVLG